jgi:hypothetical protein
MRVGGPGFAATTTVELAALMPVGRPGAMGMVFMATARAGSSTVGPACLRMDWMRLTACDGAEGVDGAEVVVVTTWGRSGGGLGAGGGGGVSVENFVGPVERTSG